MSRKIVITELKSVKILMDFSDSVCERISVLTEEANDLVGNVYVGRVENVVKNINAAFVEIKKGVKCYYSLNDNKKHIFLNQKNNEEVNIGDRLLVQVNREAMKTKPASVTSKIEIPGKYIVVSADVEGVLVSSKIKKDTVAQQIKEAVCEIILEHEGGYGVIVRTNAIHAPIEEVLEEVKRLTETYMKMRKAAEYAVFFQVMYHSTSNFCQYINNVPMTELEAVITDQRDVYQTIKDSVIGLEKDKLRFYEDSMLELYKLYSMETILKHATDRKIWLKSGGYLVIDQTEAMTVVDVNSGKQVGKASGKHNQQAYMEETFFKANMEAAGELARQLRLRNLSGIIIVDFINMRDEVHNRELLSFLSKELKKDPITSTVVDITKLGLVEITRKRNGKCLSEQLYYGMKGEGI